MPRGLKMKSRGHTFANKKDTMYTGRHSFGILLTAAILPVVTVSCLKEGVPEQDTYLACSSNIFITRSGIPSFNMNGIDSFVYFDNDPGRLDSYSSCGWPANGIVSVPSTSGERKVVIVGNCPRDRLAYEDIMSYESLQGVMCELSDEDPSSPIMSAQTRIVAGKGGGVTLIPLMARIRISRFSVDLRGRPYEDMTLRDLRAYLINVNGRYPLLPSEGRISSSAIYNYGCLEENGPGASLLLSNRVEGATLYCYPCTVEEGSPTTKLVIEGKLGGTTYYYPIVISETGIQRGCCYDFKIKITRTGMTDPDMVLNPGAAEVDMTLNGWNEYDEETLYY